MLLKKGRLEINEALGLILGVAVVALLIFFIWQIFAPDFSERDETAESYLNSLEDSLNSLEFGEVGDFSIWEGDYFLIYFNGSKRHFRIPSDVGFVDEEMYARINEKKDNNLCVCYIDSGVDCDECVSLDRDVVLVTRKGDFFYGAKIKEDSWIHYGEGRLFFKKGEKYYFSNSLDKLEGLE